MSIAPPPTTYPPAPQKPRRRWPALATAAAAGAIAAGSITTLVTFAVTSPASTATTAASAPATVTETAAPPAPPAPLPAAQADAQTCRAYDNTEELATAAAVAQGAIPQGMTITDPAVPGNPAWKAAVLRASDLYSQAADNMDQGVAAGTSQILGDTARTTASALRALGESYKAFAPENGTAVSVWDDSKTAMRWLCR
jgi:hypothetical protein